MFFIFSKIIGFLIYPIHFILLLLILYGVFVRIKFFNILSKFILIIIIFLTLLGGSHYLTSYLLWNFENSIPINLPEDPKGIILLGGSFKHLKEPLVKNQFSFNSSSERVLESLFFLKKNPDLKLLNFANSGLFSVDSLSETQLAKDFFLKYGIESRRIISKPLANNTYQEILYISDYISKIGGNWMLITSASHMPRAINLFQSNNLNSAVIYPYPTDYSTDQPVFSFYFHFQNMTNLSKIAHETIGLLAYWITGRTKRVWPDLDRIPVKN